MPCQMVVHRKIDLILIINRFSEVSHLLGLTVSLGKTEDLFQPTPDSGVFIVSIKSATLLTAGWPDSLSLIITHTVIFM